MFTGPEILDIARDAIWVALVMAGPVMLIALSIGLSIALLQALTQVQEMTLVFVPKIVAIFFSLLFFLPMMGEAIGDLFARLMALVAAG